MAYARLLKAELVGLCRERGLPVQKATKAQLIAQLEDNDQPQGQDLVPRGSSQTPPESVSGSERGRSAGTQRRDETASPGRPASSPSRAGASPAELRRLEIQLRIRELEVEDREKERQDRERERQDRERERQDRERQRQHELAMAERRTGGAPAAPSADGPQGPRTARRLERLVVAQLKDMGDIDGFLSAFERACGLQQVPIPASAAEFQAEVQADPSLQRLRDQAGLHAAQPRGRGGQERFLRERGLLFREWLPPRKARAWRVERQLVVPRKFRLKLLYLAHDVPVGGHRGIRSTRLKLLQHFYWPGIFTAVQRYCRSCDSCQRGGKAQDRRKAAWGSLPQIEDPLGLLRELWEGKSSLDGASGVEAALAVQRRLAGLMAPARETLARDQGQRKGGCDPRGQACASRPGAGRRVDRGKPIHVGPRHGRPESRGAPMSPGRVPTQRTRTSLGHERSDPAQFALGGGRTVT
ncbi:uncharacterized protein LOC142825111 [Pelodiscus sinensis]|uniref:uncharacterized protein LOC142825111 n=1 Tax=Pelodiscus sinensis TaxID=13735 RepID=UPI003F6B55F4